MVALSAVMLWAGTALADRDDFNNHMLQGDYAFTGESSCLVSLGGFTSQLTPIGPNYFGSSFMVQGIRTFNGDGTGTIHDAYSVSVVPPPNRTPGAEADTFSASFTYQVAPDGSVTTSLDGPLTGTMTAGQRAGQTYTIVGFGLDGRIGADGSTVTLGTPATPQIETQTFSNGDVHPRICTRSRVLIKLKNDRDDH